MALVNFLVLLLVGLAGAGLNYIVAYFKEQETVSLITYLLGEFHRTLASLSAIISMALGLMQSGNTNIGDPSVFAAMFAAGYALDNALNKGPTV